MIRLAIIGAGGWGHNYVVNALKHKRVLPVAFVDKSSAVLANLKREFGVEPKRCFRSVDDVLRAEAFDAAVVCVPNPQRIALVEQLLAARIHCLIEKPAAHSAHDLRRLQRAQRRSGRILMVAQNYRFLRSALYIKGLLRSGRVGSVRHVSLYFCRNAPFLAEGFYARLDGAKVIALEMGVHHIDLLNYFIGAFPQTIWGKSWHEKDDLIRADCHLSALLVYPENVTVNYSSTLMGKANRTNWTGRFEIECEKAHVVWDEKAEERIKIYGLGRRGVAADHYKVVDLPSYPEEGLARCFSTFLMAVAGRVSEQAKSCLLDANARCVLIGLGIHESGKRGRIIRFPNFFKQEYERYASD